MLHQVPLLQSGTQRERPFRVGQRFGGDGGGGRGIPAVFGGGGVHARIGYHLSFWRFFPCFTAFFASNLAIFPLKRSVLGA